MDEKTSEPILREALELFEESQDGSDFSRVAAEDDIRFARLAEQWPEEVKKLRQLENRPCLTINKLPAFIRQVVNDARQNKPGVLVHPVDNGADKDTAEVISGIVRSIWRNGAGGDVATDTAIDHAVTGGFGFFAIGIDYCHPESFDMECRIHRVPNPLMVHWDVNSTEFDASDWNYAFVSDFLTEGEFEKRYPKAARVSFEGDHNDYVQYWLQDDMVRVAQYWKREEKTRRILLLSDGNVVREESMTDEVRAILAVNGVEVTREREATYYEVTRRIISGAEVLEEEAWPGSTIPICPVWGEEVIIDGRRHFRSMVRDAKDPQTMFNYWRTASTELVALAPKAPFIGTKGFVPRGHEEKWATANTRSHAYLEYEGPQAPQRQPFAGVPAGALQEALNASDDIKSIIGIYDSSLGARSNETSGRAILARQREADVSNFHFIDNLSRAIQYAGKCLVEIIPHVYSGRQSVRILGDDMKEKVVRLMSENPAEIDPETGEPATMYDLTVGKYDVTVETGPSYATQREETREVLLEITRSSPQAWQIIGDILAEHLDIQGADRIAERLKLFLPPQVQQAEGMMPAQPMAGPQMGPPMQPGQPQGQPQPMPQGQPQIGDTR